MRTAKIKPPSPMEAAIDARIAPSAAEKRWAAAAWALPGPVKGTRLPRDDFEEEVHAAVRFCRKYWKPTKQEWEDPLPGLSSLVATGRLSEHEDRDLLDLFEAFQSAEKRHRMLSAPVSQEPVVASHRALRELRAVLRFHLGPDPRGRAQLGNLSAAHRHARSHDAIADALHGYATLAERHRRQIAGVGFDPALIDRAFSLSRQLYERSGEPDPVEPDKDPERALDLRNRFAALIHRRLNAVRAAARFLFRDHPEVVRKVTSAYERGKQAKRREKEREGKEPTDGEKSR